MLNQVTLIGTIAEMPQSYDFKNVKTDRLFYLNVKDPLMFQFEGGKGMRIPLRIWKGMALEIEEHGGIGSHLAIKGRLLKDEQEGIGVYVYVEGYTLLDDLT